MNCATQDLQFVQGDTYTLHLQAIKEIVAGTDCEPGTYGPQDITGALITMTCSTGFAGESGATVLWTISTVTGDVLITDAVNGLFSVIIPITATLNLFGTQLQSIYDLVIEVPADSVGKEGRETVLRGNIFLERNVTSV